MGKEILKMEHITKIYPNGVMANRDVSFSVREGEIHALMGENGAGKSTLMKILFGDEDATEGDIIFEGNKIQPKSAADTIRLGIGMVHQHFMLVDSLRVYENVILGMEPKNGIMIDKEKAIRAVEETAKKYNLKIDPMAVVGELSVSQKQKVEILKVLLRGAKLLILDEPTNHLDITSKEILEEALNNYTGTVLYVSHDRYFINRTATRILELTSETFINYIGNYDYYLEKHDLMNQLYAGVNGTASSGDRTASKHGTADPSRSDSTAAVSTVSAPVSNGRSDWKAQREEQAKLRKKQNELKKVEEEIATLEARGEELDEQIQQPEIASNVGKLMEIHKEKEAVDARLAELYERWEQLAEDM